MKKFAFIFAFFMIFKPVLPFLEYAVFYNYIKNELCENKEMPKLKCNGKCHLSKELAKASEQGDTSNKKTPTSETQVLFFNFSNSYSLYSIITYHTQVTDDIPTSLYQNQFILSLFKPPIVLG